jgi:hypothetical protein
MVNLMPAEFSWWQPLVGAGSGFALATARDEYRRWRDVKKHDQAVLAAMAEEITATRRSALHDRGLVRDELRSLANNEQVLSPLTPLGTGLWDLAKADPPSGIAIDQDALTSTRKVARLVGQINATMASRETFRSTSPLLNMQGPSARPMWVPRLETYDSLLESLFSELVGVLDKLDRSVAAWRRPRLDPFPTGASTPR